MSVLIAVGEHSLVNTRDHALPFCWYEDHGPDYKAKSRNDGMIYIGGFATREKAEAWAVKQGIMPEPKPADPQGCL